MLCYPSLSLSLSLTHRVGVEDDIGDIHEDVCWVYFIIVIIITVMIALSIYNIQGHVLPYDKRKGNWLISKFTKFDKE